jgi:hypothetical protein
MSGAGRDIVMSRIVLFVFLSGAVWAATDANLSSTKDRGVVSVAVEPELSDGRLMMKIVAFNRLREPASFSDANVKVATAAGKSVELIPLEQLIRDEERAVHSQNEKISVSDHNPSNYSHPGIPTNGVGGGGEPDVGGFAGANNPTSGVVSAHTPTKVTPHADPQLDARIANLKAAILHPMTIAPATAAGGEVVTEKLRFSRKDPRTLHVVVDFNGEQHEFEVEAPREGARR